MELRDDAGGNRAESRDCERGPNRAPEALAVSVTPTRVFGVPSSWTVCNVCWRERKRKRENGVRVGGAAVLGSAGQLPHLPMGRKHPLEGFESGNNRHHFSPELRRIPFQHSQRKRQRQAIDRQSFSPGAVLLHRCRATRPELRHWAPVSAQLILHAQRHRHSRGHINCSPALPYRFTYNAHPDARRRAQIEGVSPRRGKAIRRAGREPFGYVPQRVRVHTLSLQGITRPGTANTPSRRWRPWTSTPLGNGDLQVERTPSEIDRYFPVDLGPVGVHV